MFHSLSKEFLYTSYRLTVVFDDCGNEKQATGSGFFVQYQNAIFLVTCRHVVDPRFKKLGKEHWKLKRVETAGFGQHQVHVTGIFEEPSFKFSLNYFDDVAIFKVPEIYPMRFNDGSETFGKNNYVFRFEQLARDDFFEGVLAPTDQLAFPSYPAAYDQSSQLPIVRTGFVASDPKTNYSRPGNDLGSAVLYDGMSFEGSSGAPVIRLAVGLTIDGRSILDGVPFSSEVMIGVNAGSIPATYSKGNTIHSGLSYFMKSSVVRDLILDIAKDSPTP